VHLAFYFPGGYIPGQDPFDNWLARFTIQALEEAGAVVTDAYGEPLAGKRILGSGPEYQLSCVAAANRELHHAIVRELDAGIERLRRLR